MEYILAAGVSLVLSMLMLGSDYAYVLVLLVVIFVAWGYAGA